MKIDVAIQGEGFFLVKNNEKNEVYLTRKGDFTLSSTNCVVTKEGYKVLNEHQQPIVYEKETGENLKAKIAIVTVEKKEALIRVGDGYYSLPTQKEIFFSSPKKGYLVHLSEPTSVPHVDLAAEFAKMLKEKEEYHQQRYGHLRYEKNKSLKKKLTFSFRLTLSYTGRIFFSAPLLSFIEIGYNENFPNDSRAKKRDIIIGVYKECLVSAYYDNYRRHFMERVNPEDPLWREVGFQFEHQDHASRMGW